MNGTTNGELGCALIGPGKFGCELARALQEDARVRFAGVLGATPGESAAGAEALGGRAYERLDDVLRDDGVQAVLIATPSDTHAELAMAALISIAEGRPVALPLPEEQWARRAYLE